MLNLMGMSVLLVDITVKHCSHIKVMLKETISKLKCEININNESFNVFIQ